MAGSNLQGQRASAQDVERFEACENCKESVDTFLRVFIIGEPYYLCLKCAGEQIQKAMNS